MATLRRLFVLLLLQLTLPALAAGQQVSKTVSSASDIAVFSLGGGTNTFSTVSVQVAGTWVGTLQFEASVNGTAFNPIILVNQSTRTTVTTTTANATFALPNPGFTVFRVTVPSWTSGTAQITVLSGADRIAAGTPQAITIAANGGLAAFNPSSRLAGVLQITGTWVGTLILEATTNGSVWQTISGLSLSSGAFASTTTSNVAYRLANYGYLQLRARATAWTSGVAVVTYAGNDVGVYPELISISSSGGGGGGVTDATYILESTNGGLPNAVSMGDLGTGAVINTTTASVGVPSIYGGSTCTNQFVRVLSASIAATCQSVALATDVTTSLAANSILVSNGTTVTGTSTPTMTSILSPGDLTIAPTGDVILSPAGHDVFPVSDSLINLGSDSLKFLTVNGTELHVQTLVAQTDIATIGGRVLVAPTTYLTAGLSPSDTVITVKHNSLVNGDRIFLQTDPSGVQQFEAMAVISGAGGSAGLYTYSVTRNLDGSGANTWAAGDAVLDTGTTGNGYIDLYSTSGILTVGTGPAIVGNVRTGTTWNSIEPRWAIGNLDGLYGYSGSTYGVALGVPTGAWVKVDPTNGVRIGFNNTTNAQVDASGNATFTGAITATSGAIGGWSIGASALTSGSGGTTVGLDSGGSNPAIYAGSATPGSAPFRVTGAGALTATNATITGAVTATSGSFTGSLTSTSGTIGGWTLGATSLTAGSGGTTVGVDSGGTNPAFYAGSATPSAAPFRVTNAGVMTVTGATITGPNLTLGTSGSFTGSNALKFVRPTADNFGQTGDVYGAYSLDAGTTQVLNLENTVVGTTTSGTAQTIISATGWIGTPTNAAGHPAYIRFQGQGGPGLSSILVSADSTTWSAPADTGVTINMVGTYGPYTDGKAIVIGTFDSGYTNKYSFYSVDPAATFANQGNISGGGDINLTGGLASAGVYGRQGSTGGSFGQLVNFYWTGSALEIWVGTVKVGTVNITP